MTPTEMLREALLRLPPGAAWKANSVPRPNEIFAPRGHRNVFDLTRAIVVGNRGVGKTFWSHALWSKEGRGVAASTYGLDELRNIEAVFGFRGAFADEHAPSTDVLTAALEGGQDALTVWKAVLLRAYGKNSDLGITSDLVGLTKWLSDNAEKGDNLLRELDAERERRPLVVMFDALDTLGGDWSQIRTRTEGLLRLAVIAKSLRNTKMKIFMRPDQFEDTTLFRFPDASKLRAERVAIEWSFRDLYALMFFHLWREPETRAALLEFIGQPVRLFRETSGQFRPDLVQYPDIQRQIFNRMAGEWMGRDKKRGATYSWLIQHLADASGETTPRGFLTAVRKAAEYETIGSENVIDYKGISNGVAEASVNRVADLEQDYWWIDYIKGPLAGVETPIYRDVLMAIWKDSNTADRLKSASHKMGPLPLFLALRSNIEALPPSLAERLDSDEAALIESLELISVLETRSNGKINFPDIFRVAFKMKRRGGIPPKRSKSVE
ncbi:hypothetical protein [Sphingomonas sp. UYEF23]|uniref:hypothetical protein n=1 Tax=Sphingomonas sp. UYEF23 TaxID=1756408 RepID=UPI003394AD18